MGCRTALAITVTDFNGDGQPDIAATGYLQSVDPLFPPTGIVVLKNRGGGLSGPLSLDD